MRAFTVKFFDSDSVQITHGIKVDGKLNIKGKKVKVIDLGCKFIPVRVAGDVVYKCDVFKVRAYGSDTFPAGTNLIISEIFNSPERILVLVEFDGFVGVEGLCDVLVRGEDKVMLVLYPGSKITYNNNEIKFADVEEKSYD